MTIFPFIELYMDADGVSRFREDALPLSEGNPAARLSAPFPAANFQFRQSPVGFQSDFHCTSRSQWTIILSGEMEIGLRDGSARRFRAGEGFFSNDVLPEGARFDSGIHGHRSRQIGDAPLQTLFLALA